MTPPKASGQTWHERAKEQGCKAAMHINGVQSSYPSNSASARAQATGLPVTLADLCTERTPPETLNRELLSRIDSLEVKSKHLEQDRIERVEDRLSNAGIRERALCTRVEMLESLVQSQQWLLDALSDSVKAHASDIETILNHITK